MPKQPQKTFQEHLFNRIKEILPAGRSLADAVAEVLRISPDSAYRRMRGDTLLVLDEARELAREFQISLDALFDLRDDFIVFQRTEVDAGGYDFTRYLTGIHRQLKMVDGCREKDILYLTKGIPLFHLFPFRPLLDFRYYFWMRNNVEVPELLEQKFSTGLLPPEAEAVGWEILRLYNRIESIEIWSSENIKSTLLQLAFCRDAGLMTARQAAEVSASLRQMLRHLQAQAERGSKYLPSESPQFRKENFRFFYNGMGLGNDIILTTCDGRSVLYLNNDALDYLTCTDEAYCGKVREKLEGIMRRSTLISRVGEQQRNMFFNGLYAKMEEEMLRYRIMDI